MALLNSGVTLIILSLIYRNEKHILQSTCIECKFAAACEGGMQSEHCWQRWRHSTAWSIAPSHSITAATAARYAGCWQGIDSNNSYVENQSWVFSFLGFV